MRAKLELMTIEELRAEKRKMIERFRQTEDATSSDARKFKSLCDAIRSITEMKNGLRQGVKPADIEALDTTGCTIKVAAAEGAKWYWQYRTGGDPTIEQACEVAARMALEMTNKGTE